ncbi:hypothetical protein BDV96DRAFT_573548 [Lophiotrema nucula]|uniref:Uncharacterized protein n=1 Tax=Lophiotrema nucula TaxID=690887 RepID=A0A6A5Z9T2_9PLEO|nr:hypothetical protein BDV96DRAFT_573548 [Lophiotrema nucula]
MSSYLVITPLHTSFSPQPLMELNRSSSMSLVNLPSTLAITEDRRYEEATHVSVSISPFFLTSNVAIVKTSSSRGSGSHSPSISQRKLTTVYRTERTVSAGAPTVYSDRMARATMIWRSQSLGSVIRGNSPELRCPVKSASGRRSIPTLSL